MECHLNVMSLKIKCHSTCNAVQNKMSLKMKFYLKWNVTQMECL